MAKARCHNWTTPKKRHDEDGARISARAMNKKYKHRFKAFGPCPYCGDWHVGRIDEKN